MRRIDQQDGRTTVVASQTNDLLLLVSISPPPPDHLNFHTASCEDVAVVTRDMTLYIRCEDGILGGLHESSSSCQFLYIKEEINES